MLSFFPRGVLDEILNLIESVSEGFPSYSFPYKLICLYANAIHLNCRSHVLTFIYYIFFVFNELHVKRVFGEIETNNFSV